MGANKKYMDEGKAVLITKVVFGFLGVEAVSEDILRILCRRVLSRDFDSCRLLKQPPAYRLRGTTNYIWYELRVGDIDVSWMTGSGRPRILCVMFDNFSVQRDAFCGSVRLYMIGSSRWRIDTMGCDKAEIEDPKFKLEPLMVSGALFGQSGGGVLSYGDMDADTAYVDDLLKGFGLSVPLCGVDGAVSADVDMVCRLCCTRLGRSYGGDPHTVGSQLLGDVFTGGGTTRGGVASSEADFNVVDGFLGMPMSDQIQDLFSCVDGIKAFLSWKFKYMRNFASWLYFSGGGFRPSKLKNPRNFTVIFCGDLQGGWCALPVNVKCLGDLAYRGVLPFMSLDGEYTLNDMRSRCLLCVDEGASVPLTLPSGCMWSRSDNNLGVIVRGSCTVSGISVRGFLESFYGNSTPNELLVSVRNGGVSMPFVSSGVSAYHFEAKADNRCVIPQGFTEISGFFGSDEHGDFELSSNLLRERYERCVRCGVKDDVIKLHPEFFKRSGSRGVLMCCPPVEFVMAVVDCAHSSYAATKFTNASIDLGWLGAAWDGIYANFVHYSAAVGSDTVKGVFIGFECESHLG